MVTPGSGHERHARIEELLALAALGDLAGDERTELELLRRQSAPCAECDRLEVDFREAAAELAYALRPVDVPVGAESRLMTAAHAMIGDPYANRPTTYRPAPPPLERDPVDGHARHSATDRSRRSAGPRVLAAAAAVVLAAVVGVGGYAYGSRGDGGSTAQPTVTVSGTSKPKVPSALSAYLADPRTRIASLPASGGAKMSVAYQPGHAGAWVIANDLPVPTHAHVYQLWYGKPKLKKSFSPSDVFLPDGSGAVAHKLKIGKRFGSLAVTVEPPGGSKQPTTTPIAATFAP